MRWIWRALTRRLLLKFTALLCAVVLWVYVDSALRASPGESIRNAPGSINAVTERTFDLAFQIPPKAVHPLEVRRLDGRELPANNVWAQVTVRGPMIAVSSLRENVDVAGEVGVPGGLSAGRISLPISEQNIRIPRGGRLEVVAIHPKRLEFLLVPAGTPPAAEHQ